jgi:hypothetical protein
MRGLNQAPLKNFKAIGEERAAFDNIGEVEATSVNLNTKHDKLTVDNVYGLPGL